MSRLGCLLDVLLDDGVDALETFSTIADLDGVAMVAHMNARTLSGVIAIDVEDFGVAWCNARGSFLQILHIRREPKDKGPPTGNDSLLCEAVEIIFIDRGGACQP
jgi:hypothetical protein